jgi:D-lactate dehydrogenase (cytochrome)
LPGAVLYPRSTDDVVKIVKTASKYGIPLIPYCAGTSLEGQSAREVFYS